jgi:hypothetical protein
MFSVDPAGKLTAVQGSPFNAGPARVVAFSPHGEWLAAAVAAHDIAASVGIFSVDGSGSLTQRSATTFGVNAGSPKNPETAASVAFSPRGELAVAEGRGNSVGVFAIAPAAGALIEVPHSPFVTSNGATSAGNEPVDAVFSPSGAWLASANNSGNDVSVLGSFRVAGLAATAAEGAQWSGVVASDPCASSADSATIDWGDGSASTLASVGSGGDVSASHVYAEEGNYQGAVTFSDVCGEATARLTAQVADAALTPGSTAVSAVAGAPVTGAVASFSDGDPAGVASDYSATISWGDGTPDSRGTIVPAPTGSFSVGGAHTYAIDGSFSLAVVVTDQGGASATIRATATVKAYPPLVDAVTVTGTSSSHASVTVKVAPDGLPTTMHFEYGLDSNLRRGHPRGIVYDQRTTEQPVGSDFTRHTLASLLLGLVPNATYHVRGVATGVHGLVTGPDRIFRTAADPPPPRPVLSRRVNVIPVSGLVLIELPGHRQFVPLTERRQLRVGSLIDASTGTVELVTAAPTGRAQSAGVRGGEFEVSQARDGRTVLRPLETMCKGRGQAQSLSVMSEGLFETVTRLLSAASMSRAPTSWVTVNRCDAASVRVFRGTVLVGDRHRHTTATLGAGHSHRAQAG